MPDPTTRRLDFGALLPGIGVFGGVRRFLEIGNALVGRGHRFVLYHPGGERPEWLPFAGEVRALDALGNSRHDALVCGEPALLPRFEAAPARLKLFYCVLEKLPEERRIVRHPGWVVLANSSGLQDRLWRRHRVRAEEAVGGIDLELFRPPAVPRPERPEILRVLSYGRLSRRRKGTALVVRAVERFAARVASPVQLVLFDHVGPGNETDPRALLRCSIPHEFHLNMSQPDLVRLYGSCDLFVSAERRAGWNNTVAEAMACGVPVVCTPSGTRDLAQHLESAWVVRWRHPWLFERALRELAERPELRGELRRQAAERVRKFTWGRLALRLEEIVNARLGAPSSVEVNRPGGSGECA